MVKKGSFFEKLKNRWSASGVRIEAGSDGATAGNRLGEHISSVPVVPTAEKRDGRKMSVREDALLAVGKGFQELGSLVRGVQVRMEGQGSQVAEIAEQLAVLPALGQAQLEMLKAMATALDRQNSLAETMQASVGQLPQIMSSVQQALERANATDQRTVRTLDEFRTTMDRIQGSIGEMVEQAGRHAAASESQADSAARQALAVRTLVDQQKDHGQQIVQTIEQARAEEQRVVTAAVEGVSKSQAEAAQRLQAVQQAGLSSLKQAQEDQSTKLARMLKESQATSKATMVLMILGVLALASILVVLVVQ